MKMWTNRVVGAQREGMKIRSPILDVVETLRIEDTFLFFPKLIDHVLQGIANVDPLNNNYRGIY